MLTLKRLLLNDYLSFLRHSNSSIYSGRAKDTRSLIIKTNIKILELYVQEKEVIENQINDLINTQFEDVASVRHNTELNKLFHDRVSAGKSKKESLIIVAKKLASIIYSLFKYNQQYNPNRVFIQHKK